VGGPAERSLADEIAARIGGLAEIMPALGWTLGELAALCAEAVFYVGNDTGAMNLAAAVGTPTFGLFGAVPPIRHASRIVPILPADGRVNKQDGMARIAPNAVLSVIKTATAMPRSCPTPAGSPRP
jgi:heptosyltransferase-2